MEFSLRIFLGKDADVHRFLVSLWSSVGFVGLVSILDKLNYVVATAFNMLRRTYSSTVIKGAAVWQLISTIVWSVAL